MKVKSKYEIKFSPETDKRLAHTFEAIELGYDPSQYCEQKLRESGLLPRLEASGVIPLEPEEERKQALKMIHIGMTVGCEYDSPYRQDLDRLQRWLPESSVAWANDLYSDEEGTGLDENNPEENKIIRKIEELSREEFVRWYVESEPNRRQSE